MSRRTTHFFMKKLIILIILLVMLNIISFRYLRHISSNRINYIFHTDSKPIIIPRKKIILDSIEEFKIDDYFNIYSHNDYLLDYNISILSSEML